MPMNNVTIRHICGVAMRRWSGSHRGCAAIRLRVVRNLCLYRRRTRPEVFVPDPTGFPKPHAPIQLSLFRRQTSLGCSTSPITSSRTPRSPLRRETFRLAIVLLYTSGLRRGELVRLTVSSFDPSEQTLLIGASRFRVAPAALASERRQRELEAYLRSRRRGFQQRRTVRSSGIDLGRGGRRIRVKLCDARIDALFRTADIRAASTDDAADHDLRHTFAVHAFLRWYAAASVRRQTPPFSHVHGTRTGVTASASRSVCPRPKRPACDFFAGAALRDRFTHGERP